MDTETNKDFTFLRRMAEEDLKTVDIELVKRLPVNIEFTDLTYSVPISRTRNKIILRNISGYFKSGELTAILGPSGAGKSTLLNLLAGYNVGDGSGSIMINGQPRNMKIFKRLSRYIMQEDVHQPCLTVMESLKVAADLKLGTALSHEQKLIQINEILELLRLGHTKDTITSRLSGGEKKRLSIALELVNNPPVLFLDEPTTGLDDLSSSQCVQLLKNLANGGRTVVCSIHTPSAKLFTLFDNVFIVSEGQCIFQGRSENVVPFLSQFDLNCPITYNPADFVIEVSSGEYGNYHEKMTRAICNGRIHRWSATQAERFTDTPENKFDDIKEMPAFGCTSWKQLLILLGRMYRQQVRGRNTIFVISFIHLLVGLLVGSLFYKFGEDGSKTLFNFGFCFISIVVFLYIPLLPAIASFPQEVKLVKREFFNKWYDLNAYFFSLTISRLPLQLFNSMLYITVVYTMTHQPMEWERFMKFTLILALVSLISEALGLTISSKLNIVNGIFLGPALSVPLMLLAVYGMGSKLDTIPLWIQISMYASYLRFALEGLVIAIYGNERDNLHCPGNEIYCHYTMPRTLIKEVGMEKSEYWFSVTILTFYLLLFKVICYFILRQRLKQTRSTGIMWLVERYIKAYFNLSH